jgi:hypothetical protein
VSDGLIEQAKRFYHKFGPANCWTGTSGEASRIIKQLVERIEELEGVQNVNEDREYHGYRVRRSTATVHGQPQFGVVYPVTEEVSARGKGIGQNG